MSAAWLLFLFFLLLFFYLLKGLRRGLTKCLPPDYPYPLQCEGRGVAKGPKINDRFWLRVAAAAVDKLALPAGRTAPLGTFPAL